MRRSLDSDILAAEVFDDSLLNPTARAAVHSSDEAQCAPLLVEIENFGGKHVWIALQFDRGRRQDSEIIAHEKRRLPRTRRW